MDRRYITVQVTYILHVTTYPPSSTELLVEIPTTPNPDPEYSIAVVLMTTFSKEKNLIS